MSAATSTISFNQSLIEFAKGMPVGLATGASIRYLTRNHPSLSPPAFCVITNLAMTLLAEKDELCQEGNRSQEHRIGLVPETGEEFARLAGASFGFVLALTAKISSK